MRYVIYGAGAVGGPIGFRLAQHGHDVTLIARGAHLEAIQRNGLRLRTPEEDLTLRIPSVGHPREVDWRGDEAVILTTKSQDTLGALTDLRSAADNEVRVICAQNGVENERVAARRFRHVYGMLVRLAGTHLAPGEVIVTTKGATGVLDAGVYVSGVDDFIEEVCADLSSSQMSALPDPTIMRTKYAKLLVNLHNSTHVLSGSPERVRELAELLRAEGRAALAAAGIDHASAAELRSRRTGEPAPVAGFTRGGSSTWQSLARATGEVETDYLNGEVALLGRLHAVPTPANELMQQLLARMAHEGMTPGAVSVDEVFAQLARLTGAE